MAHGGKKVPTTNRSDRNPRENSCQVAYQHATGPLYSTYMTTPKARENASIKITDSNTKVNILKLFSAISNNHLTVDLVSSTISFSQSFSELLFE